MSQPNVVVCLCDQLRPFELGCYGGTLVKTPNIDALAAGGMRFEVASANCPVCTPSRSSLLTGQYGRTCTGTVLNIAETPPDRRRRRLTSTTLPEAFRKAGYRTGLIGKWHIDPDPMIVGFESAVYPNHHHRYTGQTYFTDNAPGYVVEGFTPDYEAQMLEEFVGGRNREPFFLYYNISQPHMPLADAPDKYLKMYAPGDVPLRPNVWENGHLPYDERWFHIYLHDFLYYDKKLPYTLDLPKGFDLRHLFALYCGMITWVDDQVGRLVQTLRKNGVDDHTLIVFTSDHGDNMGSHKLFNKDHIVEESIRIPMIFNQSGLIDPGVELHQIGQIIDVMPTLLSLAGVEAPGGMQGRDLSPAVHGAGPCPGENRVYIETPAKEIAVRTQTHKYGMRIDTDTHQIVDENYAFYDLREDPFEQCNLIGSPEQAEVAAGLKRDLKAWHEATPWLDVKA